MSIVAIEISPNRVLLAAGTPGGRSGIKFTHAIDLPIEAQQTDQEIGEILGTAIEKSSLSKGEAIAVVSRCNGEFREMELPPAPDDELPDMVRFKAKNDFASFSDRWLIDFVSLDSDQSLPRKVLASAIPPGVEERVQKIVQVAGLKLKRIVLRPFATMDLLSGDLNDDIARLVINPGDQFVDVVVAKGGRTVSARTIRVSDCHSAEQCAQQLLSEVRRTIASSKRQLDGSRISNVVLLDDEKRNRHLIGNLQERLDIKVDCRDPFTGLHLAGKLKKGVDSPWKFSPLLGSLAHQAKDLAPAIDFLNPTRRAEVKSNRNRWIMYGSLAATAVIGAIGIAWWTLSSQSAEIAELNEQLVAQIKRNENPKTGPSIDEVLKKTGQVDNWLKSNVNWLDELNAISQLFLTADEAIVSKLEARVGQRSPTVNVSGKISSNEKSRELFELLESRPYGVNDKNSRIVEGNAEYPFTFGKELTIVPEEKDWVSKLDQQARAFKKASETSDDSQEGVVAAQESSSTEAN